MVPPRGLLVFRIDNQRDNRGVEVRGALARVMNQDGSQAEALVSLVDRESAKFERSEILVGRKLQFASALRRDGRRWNEATLSV